MMNTGTTPTPSSHGLLTTIAYKLGTEARSSSSSSRVLPTPRLGQRLQFAITQLAFVLCVCCQQKVVYALEGSVNVCGSLIQWLRDGLGILTSAAESEPVARSVKNSGGLVIVPAFSGLYAPYWRPDARGVFVGLTSFVTRSHVVRAALEAAAFQTAELIAAMEKDVGVPMSSLRVDGGMCVNGLLLQIQADLLQEQVCMCVRVCACGLRGLPERRRQRRGMRRKRMQICKRFSCCSIGQVVRPKVIETTALGAAYAAGLAVGFWGRYVARCRRVL